METLLIALIIVMTVEFWFPVAVLIVALICGAAAFLGSVIHEICKRNRR